MYDNVKNKVYFVLRWIWKTNSQRNSVQRRVREREQKGCGKKEECIGVKRGGGMEKRLQKVCKRSASDYGSIEVVWMQEKWMKGVDTNRDGESTAALRARALEPLIISAQVCAPPILV